METLQSIARISASKGYKPQTWLRLFEEAVSATLSGPGTSKAGSELDVSSPLEKNKLAVDSLINVLLPVAPPSTAAASSVQSDALLSYLYQCATKSDAARRHLLLHMVNRAGTLLARPISLEFSRIYDVLSRLILDSGGPIALTRDASSLSVLTLVQAALEHAQLSLFSLSSYMLQTYKATYGFGNASPEAFQEEIHGIRALLAILTATPSFFDPAQLYDLAQALDRLEYSVTPHVVRRKRYEANEARSRVALAVEMNLTLQRIVEGQSLATPAVVLAGSLAARLHYAKAVARHSEKAEVQEKALKTYCADMAQCLLNHLTEDDDSVRGRSEALWTAFAFGLLPVVMPNVRARAEDLGIRESEWASAWQQAFSAASERMQTDSVSDLSKRLQRELIGGVAHVYNFEERTQPHASPDELISALVDVTHEYTYHSSAAEYIAKQISGWMNSSDIPSLVSFFRSLVLEGPGLADWLLLHLEAPLFLSGPCKVLDAFENLDDYGAGIAMELFGSLFLGIQALALRHHIRLSPSRTRSAAFTPFSYAVAKPLASLSSEHRKLVDSWVVALYGNEGIDDDLIRSTGPKTMLGLANTILQQSLIACELGIIDHDTLLGGLSYFSQDLLNFTLPGMITFLLRRHAMHSISFAMTLTIIKSLLLADSSPPYIVELISSDLSTFLENSEAADPEHVGVVASLKARLGERTTSRLDLDSLSRAMSGSGNTQENWIAIQRLYERGQLTHLVARQDPILASALLAFSDCANPGASLDYLASTHDQELIDIAELVKIRLDTA